MRKRNTTSSSSGLSSRKTNFLRSKSDVPVSSPQSTEYRSFVRTVKAIANKAGEKKYFSVSSGGFQTVDWSGTVTSISNIQQGDTDVTRDGDQAYIRSLELQWEASVGDTFNVLRFIVFQWFPATTPTVADILLTSGSNDGVLSPYTHDTRFQFKILYDRKMHLNTNTPNMSYRYRIWKDFKYNRIQYLGGTTDGQNKIYVLKISDSGAITHPSVANFTKLNFSDN